MSEEDPKDVLIAELRKENESLRKQLAVAHARIAELEAMRHRHFPGASGPAPRPPQSAPNQPKCRRKRDGQPEHPPHNRELLPPEQVSEFKTERPTTCSRCQAELAGSAHAIRVFRCPHRWGYCVAILGNSLECIQLVTDL